MSTSWVNPVSCGGAFYKKPAAILPGIIEAKDALIGLQKIRRDRWQLRDQSDRYSSLQPTKRRSH